jgi:transposase
VQLLVTAPGVQTRGAQAVLAEIGTDMKPFPTADNIVSWAKVCPGNNRTGGKDKHGKSGKGNRWLRAALGQIALAAVHTKGTYLQAKYRRLARKGKSRALVAIQHDLLRAFYHMLNIRCPTRILEPTSSTDVTRPSPTAPPATTRKPRLQGHA